MKRCSNNKLIKKYKYQNIRFRKKMNISLPLLFIFVVLPLIIIGFSLNTDNTKISRKVDRNRFEEDLKANPNSEVLLEIKKRLTT